MKNAADLSSVIHRVDLSQSEKKVPETLRSFVSEKMNPDPSSGLKLSSALPMSYGIMKSGWLLDSSSYHMLRFGNIKILDWSRAKENCLLHKTVE